MSPHKYDNSVGPDNAYGRTLALLDRLVQPSEGVHLDLACGLAPIRSFVEESHGVSYVGVDFDHDTVEILRGRGVEAHQMDLNAPDVEDQLRDVLQGRRLVAMTMLDGLEHLTQGEHVLRAVSRLLAEHRTVAVLSVPNVTHLDVAVKNVLGQWTYTPTGLLDETHYRLYSAESLTQALGASGLAKIDEADVVLVESDQHFPPEHGALSTVTPLGQFFRTLRASIDKHGETNQFVWAVSPVPDRPATAEAGPAPFLSIIMRTQGRRIQELRETLLCLAAQDDPDFEVVLVGHRMDVDQQIAVERLIEDQPPEFRRRISLHLVRTGGRAAPLNHALDRVAGRYCVMLDDDDLVLQHWVDTFHKHAAGHPGRIVRTLALVQEVELTEIRGVTGVRAVDSPQQRFASEFSLTQHLSANQSPAHTWAFPRTLHRDFGMTFDETMSTTEDWEFLIRAAERVGVTNVPDVTAIYHWWRTHESSRTAHVEEEWRQNHTEVERRLDAKPLLLPAGETRIVREKLRRLGEVEHLYEHVHSAEGTVGQLRAQVQDLESRLAMKAYEADSFHEQLRVANHKVGVLRKRVHKLRARLAKRTPAKKTAGDAPRPAAEPPRPQAPTWRRAARKMRRALPADQTSGRR